MSGTVGSSSNRMMIKLAPSPRDTSMGVSPRSSSFRSQNSSSRGGGGGFGAAAGGGVSGGVSHPHQQQQPSPRRPSLPVSPRGGAANRQRSRQHLIVTDESSPEISKDFFKSTSSSRQQQPLSPGRVAVSPRIASPRASQQQQAAASASASAVGSNSPRDPPASKATLSGAVLSSSYSAAPTMAPTVLEGPAGTVAASTVGNAATNANTEATPAAKGAGGAVAAGTSSSPKAPNSNTNKVQSSSQNQQLPGAAATTRSKRMLVVDPESGRKVHLHEDDHSLTDKELHVWHKKVSKRRAQKEAQALAAKEAAAEAKAAAAAHRRNLSENSIGESTQHTATTTGETGTLNTLNTDDHTLETASALTEVSYYGRYKLHSGPFQCIIPTSCHSMEQMALGDFIEKDVDEKVKEARDDADSVSRGRYKHLLEEDGANGGGNGRPNSPRKGTKSDSNAKTGGEDNQPTNTGVLSPITAAITNTLSPRLANITKSFFTDSNNNKSFFPEPEVVEVKFRRICLVVFPNEVKQSLDGTLNNGRGVGLLGMKFVQNGGDFQAHVNYVQRGSKAERMGVRKGDIVSFAVALSNMTEENNSFLAEKLIKRLESVGMRTSYRELYDIFLSKTTNQRPIGLVFRRWKNRHRGNSNAVGSPKNAISPTNSNIRITDEFEWSTDFLQSLSIKCREYEFEQKVPLSMDMELDDKEDKRKPLMSFLPRPNVDTVPSNGAMMVDYLSGLLDNLACSTTLPIMKCIESAVTPGDSKSTSAVQGKNEEEFLSNRTLCSLVEQSMGLIFLRRVGNDKKGTSGSGFAVVRRAEGSWSAPCFLSIIGSKDKFTENSDNEGSSSSTPEDVKMIVIRKKEMVNNLILGNAAKFIVRKDERANVLVRDAAIIGVNEGKFQLATDFFLAVKVNNVQNQGAYTLSTDQIEASDILTGTISPPEQSVDFYGALQSLELPYSMHSHPVIPDTLQRYSDSDWVEFLPDHQSTAESSCGMRTKLQMISQRNSSLEDRREIDIFARKFKYYLMDGVPVHRVLSTANNSGLTEEKVLRLTIKDPTTLFSSSLELMRKRRPGVSNVGIPSNFSTSFENVTKLSRRPPSNITNLDEEEKKRFFSVETDLSPGPVMMLAKSKKDAMILLCGLKLLLEKEKMLPY